MTSGFWFGVAVAVGFGVTFVVAFVAVCFLAWAISSRKADKDGW